MSFKDLIAGYAKKADKDSASVDGINSGKTIARSTISIDWLEEIR